MSRPMRRPDLCLFYISVSAENVSRYSFSVLSQNERSFRATFGCFTSV